MTEENSKIGNMVYPIRWANKDPATPALIDPMLDDIGITDKATREAIKKWGERFICEFQTPLDMGNFQAYTHFVIEGFELPKE